MTKYEHFNKGDTRRVQLLIESHKESFEFENAMIWIALIFAALITFGVYMLDSEYWVYMSAIAIFPIAAILYNKWKFRQLTAELQTDLSERKKYLSTSKVKELGTRTDAWTVQSGAAKYKTIQKSFDYYITTDNHTFLTKDRNLFEKFKVKDQVDMELAKNSHHVLNIRKTQHNIA